MKILVTGNGGGSSAHELVAKVLDKLHDDFGVDEIVRGADTSIDSVDRATDAWAKENGVAQRIFEVIWKDNSTSTPSWGDSVFRRNVRMLAANPALIVLFDGVESASPFLELRLVKRPVLVVEETGVVVTRGSGWGEFVRARLAELRVSA